MFDSFPPPDRALNDETPTGWPVLLAEAQPPSAADPCSTRRRDAVVAMSDGTWEEAVVWAWSWNAIGRPVQWRCQIEIGGHVRWYVYDAKLLVTQHQARLGHARTYG